MLTLAQLNYWWSIQGWKFYSISLPFCTDLMRTIIICLKCQNCLFSTSEWCPLHLVLDLKVKKIIKSISRAPSVEPGIVWIQYVSLRITWQSVILSWNTHEYTWICIMVSHDINLNLHTDWHMTTKVICYGQYGH